MRTTYYYACPKPLGNLFIIVDEKEKITSAFFVKQKEVVQKRIPAGPIKDALDNYFRDGTTLPKNLLSSNIEGTEFQKQVWAAISKIKPGKTTTYTKLAEAVGNPNAIRAVGTACGQNKVALFIPCHRVVRKIGEDMGYAWGPERKRALLEHEGVL